MLGGAALLSVKLKIANVVIKMDEQFRNSHPTCHKIKLAIAFFSHRVKVKNPQLIEMSACDITRGAVMSESVDLPSGWPNGL